MAFMRLITIVVMMATVEVASDTFTEDIVATNVGIKIEKIGKISFINDYVITSILIRLPNLSFPIQTGFNEKSGEYFSICTTLYSINREQRVHTYDTIIKINTLAREKINYFLNSRKTTLKSYLISNWDARGETPKQREKRQALILGLLGGGAMMALGGITEYQIHQIKQHTNENAQKIDFLKSKMMQQEYAIKNLGETVYGFVKNVTNTVTFLYSELACASFIINYREMLHNYIQESMKIIDDILWTALSGSNNLFLTPRMLDIEMLKGIIFNHSLLKNTIYNNIPSMMYSLAKLSLIGIDENLELAHFTLQIPILEDIDIMALYKSSQVGMNSINNTCSYYNIPDYLYKWQEEFRPLKLEKCLKNNNFFVCPKETFANRTSCIQNNVISCPLNREQCNQDSEYQMSMVGILIRNNVESDTFKIDKIGLATEVVMAKTRTAYVDWENISYVQIGKNIINSPNMNVGNLKAKTFSFGLPELDYFLDSENLTKTFDNICRKYNETLDDIFPPLVDHWKIQSQSHFGTLWNIVWHVTNSTLSILILISLLFIYLKTFNRNKNQHLERHLAYDVSNEINERRYSV